MELNIKSCKNAGEVLLLIDKNYQNWIVDSFTEYSSDYPQLNKNWLHICSLNKIQKQLILLVSYQDVYMVTSEKIDELKKIEEILSACGFVVRNKKTFIHCNICNKALPSLESYIKLEKAIKQTKNTNIKIPNEWSQICSSCINVIKK